MREKKRKKEKEERGEKSRLAETLTNPLVTMSFHHQNINKIGYENNKETTSLPEYAGLISKLKTGRGCSLSHI